MQTKLLQLYGTIGEGLMNHLTELETFSIHAHETHDAYSSVYKRTIRIITP